MKGSKTVQVFTLLKTLLIIDVILVVQIIFIKDIELMPEFNIKPIDITDFNLYDVDFQKRKVFNFIDDMLTFKNQIIE